MKKFLLSVVMMLLLAVGAYAQPFQWQYQSDFSEISQPHGIVVDHDGKLWIAAFSFPDTLNGV
ncbi:MAG: hypothetical protein KDH97_21360, partial [Calditrichaeota bacterium]|nr:hypothetical protein [Calditrichota bacterium]